LFIIISSCNFFFPAFLEPDAEQGYEAGREGYTENERKQFCFESLKKLFLSDSCYLSVGFWELLRKKNYGKANFYQVYSLKSSKVDFSIENVHTS
jgi:hypothetical protein